MDYENLTIKIYKASSEDGYFYDIYNTDGTDEDDESLDGGLCTSKDVRDAIEMASQHACRLVVDIDNTISN